MKPRPVCGIILMLLLTSMLSSAFIIQPVKAEVGLTESAWPMLFHDAQHTSRSRFIGPQTNETIWTYSFESLQSLSYYGSNQPIIGPDGVIYFGVGLEDGTGRLYAINSDGITKWIFDLDVVPGTPALDPNGMVYVGGSNTWLPDSPGYLTKIYALDPRDGTLKQTFPGVGWQPIITIGPDGTLYIVSRIENQLFAFNPDGTEKWRFGVNPYLRPGTIQTPAIGLDGTVFVSYSGWWTATDMGGGSLYALNPENGSMKWSYGFSPSTSSPSIGADGTVYVFDSARLYAFDSAGRMRWYAFSLSNWYPYTLGAPVIGSDGTIIVAGYSGYYGREDILRAFNPSGEVLWDFILPQQHGYYTLTSYYGSTPIIDSNGNVFVLSRVVEFNFWAETRVTYQGFLLHSLDKEGKTKWSYYFPWPSYLASLPSIGLDGSLYTVVWKYKYPEPPDVVLHAFGLGPAPPPPPNQPPTCVIELRKDGVKIDKIDVGQFFNIYVGDSTDDTSIQQVRFSSDDSQDGVPTGEWTEWYNWTVSSGDWNASTKIKRWVFDIPGKKEVWVEVKDDINQTSVSSRDIRATVNGKSTEFSAGDRVIIQKYNRLYKERRLDSDSYYIYENQCGRIIENENNGIFADGHFWWYVELQPIPFEYWVLEEAIIKNQPPIPSLNYAPKHPKANEEVVFDASESQDTDGKIIRYTWYLDGKFIGWTENPIMFYVFEKEGTFSLKVEVTDDCLESASVEVTIEVEGRTRPERIKKLISKDDLIKIADDLGIPHYTQDYGLWSQIEYFVFNGKTYSENELLGVLNRPIKKIGETGELVFVEDVIYGMRIRNILEDAKLVDLTSRSTWAPEKDDFKNLKKTNTWVETIFVLANWEEPLLAQYLRNAAFSLEMPALHVVGGLIGPILTIAEGYRVYETLDFLEDILYKRALWFYLQQRIGDVDSVTAFGNSPVPIEYTMSGRSETTRESWEKLYETYKPYIIPGVGGLGENFEKIKAELRKHIYDVMESYSLMPRKFVRIGSVGELRVYDSEGRVTGIVNGEIREEIPYSMYDEETETIIIFPAIGFYRYEIVGIDEGTYSLNIAYVEYGNTTTFTATDIPTTSNVVQQYTVNWDALSLGEEGVTVMVDADGDGVFEHTFTSDSELTHGEFIIATDKIPPETWLSIGEPKFVVDHLTYLTSATPITLMAADNAGGSGLALTAYRIYNAAYDNGWITYSQPFYLTGLSDGTYYIDFYSTDVAGNIELANTVTVILDNTGPSVEVVNPPAGWALQDGVTFIISAIDASGTSFMNISIREADGGEGKPVGFEDLQVTYDVTTGKWTLFFDTLQLPDGYYVVIVKSIDNLGNIGSVTVPYSIRNWAVIELLPASETNKAGRTMPVKFALRVAASVDPSQPFVYNEDLTIQIYATDDPSNILQTSTFGDTARDYRINSVSELYITNFQTLKTPKTYVVEIYRKGMLIGNFEFNTVK